MRCPNENAIHAPSEWEQVQALFDFRFFLGGCFMFILASFVEMSGHMVLKRKESL